MSAPSPALEPTLHLHFAHPLSPLDSALTDTPPVAPLDSALTNNPGGGTPSLANSVNPSGSVSLCLGGKSSPGSLSNFNLGLSTVANRLAFSGVWSLLHFL